MRIKSSLALIALLVLALSETGAQQAQVRRPQRVPATIVLVDSLRQPDAPFVVVRRPGSTPSDLILLRQGANIDELSEAIRGLLSARLADGDVALAPATFRVRPQLRRGAALRKPFPWVTRVLNDLNRAERREVPGYGSPRSVEIWLPRQGSGRAKPRT